MKEKTIFLVRTVSTILFMAIIYYVYLPALNLSSPGFWAYLFIVLLFYIFTGILKLLNPLEIIKNHMNLEFHMDKKYIGYAIILIVLIGICLVNLINSPVFQSKSYAKRIQVKEDGEFTEDIKQVNFNALPLLDKESSEKLGDRVMGQMPEFVSQYYVSDLYTQINYKGDIVRVTPLEYRDLIKYIANYDDGVKAYITVNSVTGESKLEKLDKGMKYMPSAFLNYNLKRKLRFTYPTEIFDTETFELDEKGNPYWIVPTVKYTGVGMRKEITGVVILDPITGKSKKYKVKDVPKWVDHVYSAELLIEQLDNWGTYQKGFLNSIFGQKGVVITTDGYNYTIMNDDVYLYTGVTSISKDASNIGFILSNMRTKETVFYKAPGAEEYSAMASAKGQVQQMKYKATFPLLINLNDRPTYLISLKDNAGLVKMYAFVDVKDYQKVVVTDAAKGIETAAKNYLGDAEIDSDEKNEERTIKVTSIKTAILNGTTYYYIEDEDEKRYRVSLKLSETVLPFLEINDEIKITFKKESALTEVTGINE